MKELTSAYDDLEKRMALFLGFGALLFTSLYLWVQGASLFTLLIRGALMLTVVTLAVWGWGLYLRRVLKLQDQAATPVSGDVMHQARDTQSVENVRVLPREFASTVIPSEESSGQPAGLPLPDREYPAEAAMPAFAKEEDLGDLPPPPVPPGL